MKDREQERLLTAQACPMSASVNWDPKGDSSEEVTRWLNVYNRLPHQIRVGLIMKETEESIIEFSTRFNILTPEQVGEVSRILRDSFVKGFFDENETKKRAVEKLGINENEVDTFLKELFQIKSFIEKTSKKENESEIETIPIILALKKYPTIERQILGEKKIVKYRTNEKITATIRNWIEDYMSRKGAQSHDNIERSDYIFNSENTHGLSEIEKKELLSILESYDNDSNLEVNIAKGELVFDLEKNTLIKHSLGGKRAESQMVTEEFPVTGIHEVDLKENLKKESSKHVVNLKDI